MTTVPDAPTNKSQSLMGRLLHTYFLMRRGLTMGVRAVVRSDSGQFLLVRHTYTKGWHFPGGGVEKGETAEDALRNELFEETGLQLVGKPRFHGVYFNKGVSGRDHVLVYLCTVTGEVEITPTNVEISHAQFFDASDLPADTDPGTRRRIAEITDKIDGNGQW